MYRCHYTPKAQSFNSKLHPLINPEFPASAMEREVKLQTHRELAAALPQSRHVLVPEARHYLQNETPPVVIEAIKNILLKTRS